MKPPELLVRASTTDSYRKEIKKTNSVEISRLNRYPAPLGPQPSKNKEFNPDYVVLLLNYEFPWLARDKSQWAQLIYQSWNPDEPLYKVPTRYLNLP